MVLELPSGARMPVLARLKRLGVDPGSAWVVIHPGATAPSRRYPPERFALAARRLVLDVGMQVILTGSAVERTEVEQIQTAMGVHSFSLAGELDLGELAALLAVTPLLIANNTGPVHVAAAVGTPVVDLYALTNSQHTPWAVPNRVLNHDVPCKYCYKSVCPEGHQNCLALVPSEALVEAVWSLLTEIGRLRGGSSFHPRIQAGETSESKLNARLRDRGHFRRIWVQPAAGDAGTALGAALWVDARERGGDQRPYRMDHAFLGPAYGDDEIEVFLRWSKLPYRRITDIAGEVATLLARDQVIGWFQGRMEFGPRALGARSILASPIHAEMQARLNDIKDREYFRPVAPVVLEEEAANWFVAAGTSPFMLFVHDVRPEQADRIPAVRHVDATARIRTINRSQNARYYDLLRAFHERTGVPVLVNTSFNTRGEPIVCTPRDAVESFWTSPLDALAIGSFLVQKQPREA